MTTEEGNKLIAEFIGWNHHPNPSFDQYEMNNLQYHSSWGWIMPVVEKIETLGYSTNIHGYEGDSYLTIKEGNYRRGFGESKSKIEASWLAIVEFIQWHNQNKK